jgi:hypothetical protein
MAAINFVANSSPHHPWAHKRHHDLTLLHCFRSPSHFLSSVPQAPSPTHSDHHHCPSSSLSATRHPTAPSHHRQGSPRSPVRPHGISVMNRALEHRHTELHPPLPFNAIAPLFCYLLVSTESTTDTITPSFLSSTPRGDL